MIITTSHMVENHQIAEYLGVVSAALIIAMPGGNKAVMRGWQSGINEALTALKSEAADLKADAVIAVQFITHGSHLCATGTAVRFALESN